MFVNESDVSWLQRNLTLHSTQNATENVMIVLFEIIIILEYFNIHHYLTIFPTLAPMIKHFWKRCCTSVTK